MYKSTLFLTAMLVDIGLCRSTTGLNQLESFGQHETNTKGPFNGRPSEPATDKNASHIPPDKFIIAGRPTGLAQYPWLVHMTMKIHEPQDTNMVACGGSLISPRHVLTAAHCLDFEFRSYEDVSVYLAEYNTQTFPNDCVGSQCIKNLVMHPDMITIHEHFDRQQVRNDIGMLRLSGPTPNSEHIRPIPLPTFNINVAQYEGTPLTIAGWGQTEFGQASPIKLHAQVQLISLNTCRRYFAVTSGMLCAAGRNRQDCCFGDSGGPIMVEQQGNYQLVGVVSFGDSKCGGSKPSVYTNVFSYLDWIQKKMRN
ncbi:phenoloxidase-activating enzyme-like [Leguminivora glycinivorella]|uniref:phenoloxidase-activating enzyme-like n=1 Tax=Leguminivora glycinivorella TaxID=1035111 RepID=UPI00200CDABD|nr:phenoloxidase-activating enzyme-like [Leguminivora glycinivorella]